MSRWAHPHSFLLAAVVAAGALLPQAASADSWGAATLEPAPTQRALIVGGTRASISEAPWQVRLRIGRSPVDGSYFACGGTIIDANRIVTAAHCAVDNGTTRPPSDFEVFAGASAFKVAGGDPVPQPGDQLQTRQASSVRVHPSYRGPVGNTGPLSDFRDDVAVVTLRQPLSLNGTTARAAALPGTGAGPAPGTALSVSGFGRVSGSGEPDGYMYRLATAARDPLITTGPYSALFVAASAPTGSPCQGDSGGPLMQDGTLVGVISSGGQCLPGDTTHFTNVSAGEILEFVKGSDTPPDAPEGGSDVRLLADAGGVLPLRPGRLLTCSAGVWTAAPTFTYQFFEGIYGGVLQDGPSDHYALTDADVGRQIGCRATATTAGGVGRTPPTTTTPPVEVALRPAPSIRITAPSRVKRGRSLRVTLTVTNYGNTTADNVITCATLPKQVRLKRRGGGRKRGRSLCFSTDTLPALKRDRLRFRVAVSKRTRVKSIRFKAKTAMGGLQKEGSRTVRIRRR